MHLSSTVAQVSLIFFRFNLVQFLAWLDTETHNPKICFSGSVVVAVCAFMISDLTNVDQQLLSCAIG